MNNKKIILFSIISISILFFLFGCSRKRVTELKKERLFSIPIGVKEEQIGVLRERNGRFIGPSLLLFKNGFYYLVDTVNQKILKITTPGDIILILSKGESEDNRDDDVLRTKQRVSYYFNQIGSVAIDSENNLWIEDKYLEKEPEKDEIDLLDINDTFDDQSNEIYKSYILKFDRVGRFIFKLGKGGIDTDPFYYIYKMVIDDYGNFLVLTADDDWASWVLYRFDSDGNLINKHELVGERIIDVKETDNNALFIMDLVPSYSENLLLFWISLYETDFDTTEVKKEEEIWGEEIEIENFDEFTKEEEASQNKYLRDLLNYKLIYFDIGSEKIEKTYTWENRLSNQQGSTTEFFGIDRETNGFLWKYVDSTKSIITVFRPNGSIIARRSFIFEDDGIWTNVHVDEDGSISALKIDRANVHFYRWRSDKLISGGRDEKLTFKEFVSDMVEAFKKANR
ncbi:MAG: hypothetical protein JSV25_08475 [Spirochaetota bacterium]|nr:MAG: hypothetical protein JSV25_08475 [Spirochaetota bacterium]